MIRQCSNHHYKNAKGLPMIIFIADKLYEIFENNDLDCVDAM